MEQYPLPVRDYIIGSIAIVLTWVAIVIVGVMCGD